MVLSWLTGKPAGGGSEVESENKIVADALDAIQL